MYLSNKKYQTFLYLLFLFLISSIIGGLLESAFVWSLSGKFDIGGFMYGPWRPIYGFGCLLLYFITRKTKGSNLVIFLTCMIICSLFEYLSSWILEFIFNRTWWDYTNNFLNLNGRICLFNSVIWGALGLIFLRYIEPFLKKIFQSIDIKKMTIILMILFLLYHVDGFFSWANNLK